MPNVIRHKKTHYSIVPVEGLITFSMLSFLPSKLDKEMEILVLHSLPLESTVAGSLCRTAKVSKIEIKLIAVILGKEYRSYYNAQWKKNSGYKSFFGKLSIIG